MGSSWGNNLKVSIFGESHGKSIGVIIDGFPAGLELDMEFIHKEMARRAPGQSLLTTSRRELDRPLIQSGIYEEKTTGAPICMMIQNHDTRSKDYSNLRIVPRPSHSDYTGKLRYAGFNDIRGGGHFSGRLTAPMVFAGALCKSFLMKYHKIEIGSHIASVGTIQDEPFDLVGLDRQILEDLGNKQLSIINEQAAEAMKAAVDQARMDLDSLGGVIECAVVGIGGGLGSPMLQSVESRIASILYGVPAVKGVEFGLGFEIAKKYGSQVNDCYIKNGGMIQTRTNNNGGISGGITTGMPIVLRVAIKPTPSISKEQKTLNLNTGEEEILKIHGRHDPCIAMRAPVVIESAVAIAIMDLYLEAFGYDAR